MNVILIISDTYRWDNLGCYGGTEVHTPNLDRLAKESYVFENAYLTSFPTVPNRHDIMTGKATYTYAGWQPLPADAITLQEVLGSVGISTALVADTPHLIGRGFNYQRGFDAFEWVRGQENDHYRSYPRQVTLPCSREKLRMPDYTMVHYVRNTSNRRSEADYFVARTMAQAGDWLEENAREGPFFLWVDTFDPHEPWDPPQHYVDLYDPGYEGEEVIYPRYDFWQKFLTPEELNHCRALYAGEATMVDRWVGRLLDQIDTLGLRDDTAVIFTSDHGFLFGEHGVIGKSIITEKGFEAVHLYQEIARVPLLVRLPGGAGQRVQALVQSHDLMPTILELCGVIMTESVAGKANVQVLQCGMYKEQEWQFDPSTLHGSSLVPLMHGEEGQGRDLAVCSAGLTVPSPAFAKCAVVTQDGWCLFYAGEPGPAESDVRLGKAKICTPEDAVVPFGPELYYLPDDPGQENNLIDDKRDVAEAIHARYVAYLESIGTKEQVLNYRRRLFW